MRRNKIGILDWGIGGFGLYAHLKLMGNPSILYLSDAGHEPYGKVPKDELQARVATCIRFLKDRGATHIAIACNAAGTVVSDSSCYNVLNYGKALIEQHKALKIGIIGGKRLVESKVFPDHFPGLNLPQRIAQKMSAHIEAGTQNSEKAKCDLTEILTPLFDREALLLACTHYPAISEHIRTIFPNPVRLLDPAQLMAIELMETTNYQEGIDEIFTSGDLLQTQQSANFAFGVKNLMVKTVKL